MLYMNKIFSTIFRRYGITVQIPYYDHNLVDFVLSQPIHTVPIHRGGWKDKPLAQKVAQSLLPPGHWDKPKYNSPGFNQGAGLTKQTTKDFLEPFTNQAEAIATELWSGGCWEVAKMHLEPVVRM